MEIVVEPKFMCPTHSEAKQAEMSEFGAKFISQGGANLEDGRPRLISNPSCWLPRV